MTRLAAILPLALLGACIPFPHTVQDLPRLHGTMTLDGAPARDVRVQVADVHRNNPCEKGEQAATTDAAGKFSTPGRRRLAFLVPLLPVHGLDSWAVALLSGGNPLGYIRPWNYRAGPRYSPGEVTIACDLRTRTCEVNDLTWRRKRTVLLLPCDEFGEDKFSGTP